MAKKSMIQREKKREKLVAKYGKKRNEIKQALKNVTSYKERLELQEYY